ncbi:MAG: hypothetical protein ACFB6R_06805 [Alphaproteobacteria bacterium]
MPAPIWIANAALAAACGLAGVALHGALSAPAEPRLPRPGSAGGSVETDRPALPVVEPVALRDLPQTRNRPVFSPDRRPPAQEVTQTAETAEPRVSPGTLVLAGVVLSERTRAALLRPAPAAKAEPVGLGETVQGWTVSAIAADHVRLSAAGQTVRLDLRPSVAQTGARSALAASAAAGVPVQTMDVAGEAFDDAMDDIGGIPRRRSSRPRSGQINGGAALRREN